VDRAEFKRYAAAMKSDETRRAYFDSCASSSAPEAGYLRSLPALPPEDSAPADAAPLAPDAPIGRAELIASVIAGAVRDGEFTAAGTGCWEVAAGLRLAQLTHAPNLTFTLGGTAAVNHRLRYLPVSINTEQALAACEARIPLEDLFDLELAGQFDVMFASALQIDGYGNLNLACIGPYEKPVFRGPGTVGLEFAPCARRIVAFFRQHTKNVFVEKVDFISGIGYGTGPDSRAQWGIPDSTGPALVVSNLAVMDYHPETLRMRLKSVHPGVSISEVLANTGFELHVPATVPETPLPTAEELLLLRTEIDRGGMLRKLISWRGESRR
jgi:glutaconate CoA-transferase subunit B